MDFALSAPLTTQNAEADDIRAAKIALNRLGYYEPDPEIGITDFTDRNLFDAIQAFQADKKLSVTGSIRPDDDTARMIARAIEDQPISARYIWRTCRDDDVRSEHAAREGKVFYWTDHPLPGDDHNCRCWAEPFTGQKTVDQIYDPPIEPVYPEILVPALFGKTAIGQAWRLWLTINKRDPEWNLGAHKKPEKWVRQMEQRKWTPEQISEAIKHGTKHPAPNKVNSGNTATRYEYDGKFIVRDDKTKQILQISGEGKFAPNEIGQP